MSKCVWWFDASLKRLCIFWTNGKCHPVKIINAQCYNLGRSTDFFCRIVAVNCKCLIVRSLPVKFVSQIVYKYKSVFVIQRSKHAPHVFHTFRQSVALKTGSQFSCRESQCQVHTKIISARIKRCHALCRKTYTFVAFGYFGAFWIPRQFCPA